MINKVTYQDCPDLFENIDEFSIESDMDHRKNSNFYREDIIELRPEHKQYFESIDNFEDYIGLWRTNNVIWDDNYGFEDEFSELTRVEKKVKVVETVEYVEVK